MSSNGLIRVKREGAQRARRMASFMTAAEDKARMFAYADELDAQADALEATEEAPLPVVEQVQVQQGPPAKDDEEK